MTIGGCISTIQDTDISSYHESKKLPNFELVFNGTDNYSKQKILVALNRTDQDVARYISSINIVTELENSECNDNNSTGCVVGNFTTDGQLEDARIYILGRNLYKDLCNTFEHTLYHEIGHTVYFYKFGDHDVGKQDKFYQASLELYAEKYADQYSKMEGCDGDILKQLEYNLSEKEHIYQYALKTLSKWGTYKYRGVPENIYREYNYDYDLYLDAKKEYNDALGKFKDYIKRSQE